MTLRKAAGVIGRAAWNIVRRKLGMRPEPSLRGKCTSGTPTGRIPDLQPGDWVQVKTKEEIEATLDRRQKNRGLLFDVEMLPFCGQRFRLLTKVERIIDERTGAMRSLPNDCWILEGTVCSGHLSRGRLFCTRRIYPFWREIWLKKVEENPQGYSGARPDQSAATHAGEGT